LRRSVKGDFTLK